MKHLRITLTILTAILASAVGEAKVTLPSIMSDNMVLQRNTRVNIWGKAAPGAEITVVPSWDSRTYTAIADKNGDWITKITTGGAGGPYSISVSDGEPVVLNNILLGEVWICSGQSNMEMQVHGFMHQPVAGGLEAILDAPNHPQMRYFTVGRA